MSSPQRTSGPPPARVEGSTAGLILAGGAGRRFGEPKAFAALPDGRTFLAACTSAMTAAGLARFAATVPPGASVPPIEGLRALPLPAAGLDMFTSIRFGLEALVAAPDWEAVIILPVDHPLVRPVTIAALAAANHPAVIPTLAGRHGHPIRVARAVAEGITSGLYPGPTLREVLRAVRAVDLAVDDPGIRANCNTREAMLAAWALTSK